jgi:hypothetical protein
MKDLLKKKKSVILSHQPTTLLGIQCAENFCGNIKKGYSCPTLTRESQRKRSGKEAGNFAEINS